MFVTFLARVIYDFLCFGDTSIDDDDKRNKALLLIVINIQSLSVGEIKSNLIEIVLFDFLLSRCSSDMVDCSLGLRPLDDIRRKNLRKLILLPVLANDVSEDRSVSLTLVVSLNRIGDEIFRDKGCFARREKFGCSDFGRRAFSLSLYFLRSSGKGKSTSLSLHSSIGSGKSDHSLDPKLLEALLNCVE